jgi:4a-hydroxytetrahydrobiopterin dehydratase
MTEMLPDAVVTERVDQRHWRVLLGRLHATFDTGSFARGLVLVERIAALAEEVNHHPDVDLRYALVHVTLVSHDAGGLTERDVALAGRISEVADDLRVAGLPTAAAPALEVAIDALDIPAVRPFWKAVLAYDDERPTAEDAQPALVDPAGVGPAFWFQQMDEPRPQRNRLHIDVTVPHDVAEARVAAAIAAGGRLVSDTRAPSFWVLADPEGNEACVCTWQARG